MTTLALSPVQSKDSLPSALGTCLVDCKTCLNLCKAYRSIVKTQSSRIDQAFCDSWIIYECEELY